MNTNAVKQSSKLLIVSSKGPFTVFRAPGPWTNPDSHSLPGTDGETLEGVIKQAEEKFGLTSTAEDWEYLGAVPNPANNEVNHLWRFKHIVDVLELRVKSIGGLLAFDGSRYWDIRAKDPSRISPALASIMDAWASIPAIEEYFGVPQQSL